MRKKITIALILTLIAVLTLSLVACNGAQDVDSLPDEVGADKVNQSGDTSKIDTYLRFYMPDKVSSIFSSIYVDEFDLSDVKYAIVYTDGKTTTEINGGNVTESMVADDDKPLLSQAGHHQIHVSTTLSDGSEVTGSFALHLKDRYHETEQVTVKFNLGESNAQAHFADSVANGVATVKVDKDIKFESWEDFYNAFTITCAGKAIESVSIGNDNVTFPYTLSSNVTFTVHWTENVIKATLLLNTPLDASVMYGYGTAQVVDGAGNDLTTQNVVRGLGKITAPVVDKFNIYNGYYFAGWYQDSNGNNVYDEDDILWNFSSRVGDSNITLVARWTERSYSFTLYTTGGAYPADIANSEINGKEITCDQDVTDLGKRVAQAACRFGVSDGALNRIVVSGLAYGTQYSQYVVKVQTSADSDQVKYLTFEDMIAKLVKGNGNYVVNSGIYRDYQCSDGNDVDLTEIKADSNGVFDDIGYIKWTFNEPEKPSDGATETEKEQYRRERLERMSEYYLNVVFKDSLSIKADGSIRIDRIDDESVSELIIPATLIYNGKETPITEIAAKSCMNLKAMILLDMSEASNLITIGEEAFAHCPSLSNVKFPTESKIEEVGARVFYASEYENNYHDDNDQDFIVINNVLYKYVGEDNAHVDLSSLRVKIIADGAFADRTDVTSVTLCDSIEIIQNGAFENCAELSTLNLTSTSNLRYIGETAFDGCSKLIVADSGISNLYVDKIGGTSISAIIIGKVYYRMLDKSATSATIPTLDGVAYIAPNAFDGCTKVENIYIPSETPILEIGKDAFSTTKWVEKNEYTIVNKILSAYYTNGIGAKTDIELPSDDNLIINEHAFNSFANQISTITFGTNVKKINDYAFVGASSLVSMILTKVTVEGGKLVGVPEIDDYAFANSNGKLLSDVKFFFTSDVIEFLKKNSQNANIADTATSQWIQLYNQYSSRFVAEEIETVRINPEIISDKLVLAKAGEEPIQALIDKYGTVIENALIKTSNTKVQTYETLVLNGKDSNDVVLKLLEDSSTDDLKKYLVTFKYRGSETGCQNKENDPYAFVLTIVDAIKGVGTDKFMSSDIYGESASSNNIVDASGKTDNDLFYIKGFEGQVEGEKLPTFYTSYVRPSDAKLQLVYTDVNGNTHSIDIPYSNVTEFNTTVANTETTSYFTAYVTVNFHDIGTYKFKMNYAVKVAKYASIKQTSAVSIPINGVAATYFNRFSIDLIGQDELATSKSLSKSEFSVIEVDGIKTDVVNTSELGLHTMKIQYSKTDAVETLTQIITYTVVLQADASIFTYDVNYANYTAKITACSEKKLETIVIPTTYTINNYDTDGNVSYSDVFTVTTIADGVFKNNTTLKAIYLGENITTIGNHAFEGCTSLENVYTIKVVRNENAELTANNFDFDENNYREFISKSDQNIEVPKTTKDAEGKEVEVTEVIDGEEKVVMAPAILHVTYKEVIYEVTVKDLEGISHNGGVLSIGSQYYVIEEGEITDAPQKTDAAQGSVVQEPESKDNQESEAEETKVIEKVQTITKTIYQIVGIDGVTLPSGTQHLFLPDTMYIFGDIKGAELPKEKDQQVADREEFEMHIYNSTNGIRYTTESYVNSALTNIGAYAFYGCTSLKNIDLSKATELNDIGAYAFSESGLESIDLSNNTKLVAINTSTFEKCENLASVTIPSNVTKLMGMSFKNCANLVSFAITGSNGLTDISDTAFEGCNENLVLPTVK